MAFSYIYFLYMYKHISYTKKVKKKNVFHSVDHKNQIVRLKQGVIILMYCGDIFYFYNYYGALSVLVIHSLVYYICSNIDAIKNIYYTHNIIHIYHNLYCFYNIYYIINNFYFIKIFRNIMSYKTIYKINKRFS